MITANEARAIATPIVDSAIGDVLDRIYAEIETAANAGRFSVTVHVKPDLVNAIYRRLTLPAIGYTVTRAGKGMNEEEKLFIFWESL